MSIDTLKLLSENYAIDQASSTLTDIDNKRELIDVLEHVQEISDIKFPAEAVPVFEAKNADGDYIVVVESYDLARFMESYCESDPLIAFGIIASTNSIPNSAKFAVLIDKRHLTCLKEAAETNKASGLVNVGHATNMLRNLINQGIQVVSKK